MNILMEEYFMDKDSAQKGIGSLPAAITGQAEAIQGLNPAIFYYRMQESGREDQ
jgi:hypothetical protein